MPVLFGDIKCTLSMGKQQPLLSSAVYFVTEIVTISYTWSAGRNG